MGQLNVTQIVANIAPGVMARVLRDALQQQREDGDRDVGMDAMRRPMKHWPQAQPALHVAPTLLDPLQLLVAERHVGRHERVVVAVHDELAVAPLGGGDGLAVDRNPMASLLEIAPIALAGAQSTDLVPKKRTPRGTVI